MTRKPQPAKAKAVKMMMPGEIRGWDRIEKAIVQEIRKWDGIYSQEELQQMAPFIAVGCVIRLRRLVTPIRSKRHVSKRS